MSAPSRQKASVRPISFVLRDDVAQIEQVMDLYIRPEDLSRTDASRMSVYQTLGGAYIDSFGPGLRTFQIAGHTGWRRDSTDASDDGIERFKKLYDQVIAKWHEYRKNAIDNGRDPNSVRLIFVDGLDETVDVVVPNSFNLKRNRSRPLLAQYQVSMTSLGIDPGGNYLNRGTALDVQQSLLTQLGLQSLERSLATLNAFSAGIGHDIDATTAKPLSDLVDLTAKVLAVTQTVLKGVDSAVTNVLGPILNIGNQLTRAAANLIHALVLIVSFPKLVKLQLMQTAAALENVVCLIANAFRQFPTYRDYSDVYGASNCSSTNGGRPLSPLAGQNPFELIYPRAATAPATVSAPATAALVRCTALDPATTTRTAPDLLGDAALISNGITLQ